MATGLSFYPRSCDTLLDALNSIESNTPLNQRCKKYPVDGGHPEYVCEFPASKYDPVGFDKIIFKNRDGRGRCSVNPTGPDAPTGLAEGYGVYCRFSSSICTEPSWRDPVSLSTLTSTLTSSPMNLQAKLMSKNPSLHHVYHHTGDFLEQLREEKATEVPVTNRFGGPSDPIIIPPLNTDIRLASVLPAHKADLTKLKTVRLPDQFNWREKFSASPTTLTSPPNQMLCGSCWAVSSAGVLSDLFAIRDGVNPRLSSSYILSCLPQGQCNGGNPAQALIDIMQQGVGGECNLDYSWCGRNDNCSGQGSSHFGSDGATLNGLIPVCPKCTKSTLYFCEQPTSLLMNSDQSDPTKIVTTADEVIRIVKEHILENGPVIGTYLVFTNFLGGNYSKTQNVYVDKETYDGKAPGIYSGAHAITVLGWGNTNPTDPSKGIPFWHCRNSWGEKWGDKGYFKMAMYPVNTVAQFELAATVDTKNGSQTAGGFVLVKPRSSQRLSSVYGGKGDSSSEGSGMMWVVVAVVVVVVAVGVILVYYM